MLLLGTTQFGYHMGNYYYCRYRPDDFDITYIGRSRNLPEVLMPGIRVITTPAGKRKSSWGSIIAFLQYFFTVVSEVFYGKYDVIFIKYFPFCSLLRWIAPRQNYLMDIRSGSVKQSAFRRKLENLIIRWDGCFFKHISVISAGLAAQLKIPRRKYFYLPLGAVPLDMPDRVFDSMRLIYVGTFFNRKLEHTLLGVKLFIERHPEIPLHYEIIGNGPEENRLREMITDMSLQSYISLSGYIQHDQLKEHWRKANVGVSFVPIIPMFDMQPPTKTFEYLAAGMPVIATETHENRLVITEANGILCRDTPESFERALELLWARRKSYRVQVITASIGSFRWDVIAHDLFTFLRNLAQMDKK